VRKLMSTELGPAGGYLSTSEVASGSGPRIVMLVADHDTQAALSAWAQAQGFDLTQAYGGRPITADMFDFHITLLASANDVAIPVTDHRIEPVQADATGFLALGPEADTPALALSSDGPLADLRAHFLDTYGAEPTYADFKPHISLSYAWSGEPALDDLPLPDFALVFDRLVIDEFVPDAKSVAPGVKAFDDGSDAGATLAFVLEQLDRLADVAQAAEVLAYDQDIGWQMLHDALPMVDDSLAGLGDLLMQLAQIGGDQPVEAQAMAAELELRGYALAERLQGVRVDMVRAMGEIGRAGLPGAPFGKGRLAT
jgi:hypothetical protein